MSGKFNSLKDEVINRTSLDGTTETLGDVDGFGFYALVSGFYGKDYILHEDSQGFVYVDSFDAGEATGAWEALEDAYFKWTGGFDA